MTIKFQKLAIYLSTSHSLPQKRLGVPHRIGFGSDVMTSSRDSGAATVDMAGKENDPSHG